jgi:hypothetical protein
LGALLLGSSSLCSEPFRASRLELAVSVGEDLFIASDEFVSGSDIAKRAVESDLVVVGDEVADDASCLLNVAGRLVPEVLALERSVPAFKFTVALRIVGARADMGDSREPDELLEVLGDELRAVVGDDSRLVAGVFLQCPLDDGVDFLFLHRLANLPMDNRPAVAVEHGAEEVEGARDIEVGDVDVPVFVGMERLHEALSFFDGAHRLRSSRPAPLRTR